MPPPLTAVSSHKQSGIKRDIAPVQPRMRMEQAISPNYSSPWITQDGKPAARDGLPHLQRVFAIIHADGYKARAHRLEVFCVLRELAQLARTVRSPVAPIEDQ